MKRYTLTNKIYLISHGLLFSLFIMGFAFANCFCTIAALPCTCSILPHAGYFFLLNVLHHIYGGKYRPKFVLTHVLVGSFLAFWAWAILACFPTDATSPIAVAVWERALPLEAVFTWLLLFLVGEIPLLHWILPKSENFIASALLHTLIVGSIGHIVMLGLAGFTPFYELLAVQGNFYGFTMICIGAALLLYCGLYLSGYLFKWDYSGNTLTKETVPVGYQVLLLCFCGVCIFTNLLVVKYIRLPLGDTLVTAGLFMYVFTFVFTDVIEEVYGHFYAVCAIWSGWIANIGMLAMVMLVGWFGADTPFPTEMGTFQGSFRFAEATIVASMVAYFIGQFTDVYLFGWLRKQTRGRYLWLRNNVATIASQLLDTFIFAGFSWYIWTLLCKEKDIIVPWTLWRDISMHEYLCKVLLALLDTPLVYCLVYALRRWEAYGSKAAKNTQS